MKRRALAAVIVVATATMVVILVAGHHGHRIVIETTRTEGAIKGMAVRASGQKVGKVTKAEVTEDHNARLELTLDDAVWPLPRDTTMQLRLGGTVKYTDRYIDLRRGTAKATLSDGAVLPPQSFTAPEEFDQVFATFDTVTRRKLRGLLGDGAAALTNTEPDLQAALDRSPPALAEARALLGDLGYDRDALHRLVRSGDAVVNAVQRSNPGVGELVTDAATTLDAVAGEATALQRGLSEAPYTLASLRRTLGHADRTLPAAERLLATLAPGVREAKRVAAPLGSVLRSLVDVGPSARSTLASLRTATPDLSTLLHRARPLMGTIESIGRQAVPELDCIRPYTPELAGLVSTWAPGAWGRGDGKDKYLRAEVGSYPLTNANVESTAAVVARNPGTRVAFPQPPGFVAGEPWFLAQCGITKDSFDPGKDPESQATELYPQAFKNRRLTDPEAQR